MFVVFCSDRYYGNGRVTFYCPNMILTIINKLIVQKLWKTTVSFYGTKIKNKANNFSTQSRCISYSNIYTYDFFFCSVKTRTLRQNVT